MLNLHDFHVYLDGDHLRPFSKRLFHRQQGRSLTCNYKNHRSPGQVNSASITYNPQFDTSIEWETYHDSTTWPEMSKGCWFSENEINAIRHNISSQYLISFQICHALLMFRFNWSMNLIFENFSPFRNTFRKQKAFLLRRCYLLTRQLFHGYTPFHALEEWILGNNVICILL